MSDLQNELEAPQSRPPHWREVPLTLGLIILSVLGFAVFSFDRDLSWVSTLTYTAFEVRGDSIVYIEQGIQPWRAVTPIFLHFGWLHIVFNGLWTWDLGARIEKRAGWTTLGLLVLLAALGSNWLQFQFSGPSLFGGMSGVVYALLTFCWILQHWWPESGIDIPWGIYLLMLGWLVLCMTGLIELLGFGAIANAAHVGGCVVGLIAGVVYLLWRRARPCEVL